ncbi:MAG: hypothetical protein KAY04_03435 [Burkholderiales bacterium]|nr:hypothetical protein [Burkholderiales bacterium]
MIRRPRNSAAAFFFALIGFADAASPAPATDHAVTLSAGCVVHGFRLPGLVPVATFDAGDCATAAAVRSVDQSAVFIGTRDGELLKLATPELGVTRRRPVDGRVMQLFAPDSAPLLLAVVGTASGAQRLLVLDRDSLATLREVPLQDRLGDRLFISRIAESTYRNSVLLAFGDAPELWELFLAPDAAPVFEGLVHDYRMGEAISEPARLPIRRIRTGHSFDDFLVEPDSPHLMVRQRSGDGARRVRRFNLDVRRTVAEFHPDTEPMLSSAITVSQAGQRLLLAPTPQGVQLYRMPLMTPIGPIELTGDGCRIASPLHKQWAVLWACGGDDARRFSIIDAASWRVMAVLDAGENGAIRQLAIDSAARRVLVASSAGMLVSYRTDEWCREGEIRLEQLRAAWLYP